MKKRILTYLMFIAFAIVISSCTPESLTVQITNNTASDVNAVLKCNEESTFYTFSTGTRYLHLNGLNNRAELTLSAVKSESETNIADNAYQITKDTTRFYIKDAPRATYYIKSSLPSTFSPLYLSERNGKIGRYGDRVLLPQSGSAQSFDLYTERPAFYLTDASGAEISEISGYPIEIKVNGNIVEIT